MQLPAYQISAKSDNLQRSYFNLTNFGAVRHLWS